VVYFKNRPKKTIAHRAKIRPSHPDMNAHHSRLPDISNDLIVVFVRGEIVNSAQSLKQGQDRLAANLGHPVENQKFLQYIGKRIILGFLNFGVNKNSFIKNTFIKIVL
jgi:hypothetical protein